MKNNKFKMISRAAFLAASCVFTSASIHADDTEIFFSENLKDIRQNIMFIIDGSGSMDIKVSEGGDSRLEVMKNALSTVLKSAPDNLNVGLMNYGEDPYRIRGHGVKFPSTPINDKALPIVGSKIPVDAWGNKEWWYSSIPEPDENITVREYLSQITDWYWKDNWYTAAYDGATPVNMPRQGATPIVDALYEAALYFRGDAVGFGLGDAGYWNRWAAHPSTYEGDIIKWDNNSCNSTYEKTVTPAIDFANNEYPWLKCKGRELTWLERWWYAYQGIPIPDNTPSYQNCQNTESCQTLKYSICDEKVAGYCSNPQVTELGTTCPDGAWVDSYCKNNKYHYEYVEKCSYDVCEGDYTPKSNYKSPIAQECQNNYIVLLSDGKPGNYDSLTPNETYLGLKSGKLPTLTNKADSSDTFSHVSCDSNPSPSGFRHGVCGPELARFLADSDSSDLKGKQGIQMYTIGFGLGGEPESEEYLKSLVTADNPETEIVEGYFSANDENQLSNAFSTILNEISSTTTSFAAPGYSVNTSTGLSNEKVVYIPVFDKQLTPRWNGNLKKFKLDDDGNGLHVIKGKNNKVAVSELGVFEEDALDLWSNSTSADGREVSRGGASSLIDPNNRLAVTDLACSSYPCDLTTEQNLLKASNAMDSKIITNEVLGLPDVADESLRVTLVNFARGRVWNEVTGVYDLEPHMGDMLHTEPVVVTYDKTYMKDSYDSDTSSPGQVVFAATNEGYLHAFNSVTGQELFAYMPSDLMKNINVQYENTDTGNHAYGIDGYITTWFLDKNKDGIINKSGGDRVYLYFGLRRGGRAYYALDVTDVTAPKLMWKISGESSQFSHLGQSWSMPYLARIRTSDTEMKEAVIFTGGYDVNQDEEDLAIRNSTDSMGNDLFIVDAMTGDYIWSLQGGTLGGSPDIDVSGLTHSIPGGARMLDMNRDGAIDRMYFADTAGQVWRLELPTGPSYDLSDSKLILFAELGDTEGAGAKDSRMFFNEPDVALLKHGKGNWLTVSIGSGYRAHPANENTNDNFYVLLDNAVNVPLEKTLDGEDDFKALKASDLVQLSWNDGEISKGEMSNKTILNIDGKAGWYLRLPETGEKVLSNSITTTGSVMFTTLVPGTGAAAAVADPCTAPATQGRFYSVNLLTGDAGSDLSKDGKITDSDLFAVVSSNEIPGSPQRVFNDPICENQECEQMVDIRVGKKSSPVTDYDSAFLESVFWTNPATN